jgi:hypothetical protein
MDKNKKFYLTIRPQTTYIALHDIVAKIEFIGTPESTALLDALNRGQDITIKPFGYGEKDDAGNFKDFTLMGFTII